MRISRHQMLMEMARVASKRSTCHRLNVGAIIAIENRPISVGYNGSPPGEPHCAGNGCTLGPAGGCIRARHAEWNAIEFLRESIQDLDASIYCTHSPCRQCADHIINAGITRVYYETPYRDTSAVDHLVWKGISVFKYSPSGYLFNHSDQSIMEA